MLMCDNLFHFIPSNIGVEAISHKVTQYIGPSIRRTKDSDSESAPLISLNREPHDQRASTLRSTCLYDQRLRVCFIRLEA